MKTKLLVTTLAAAGICIRSQALQVDSFDNLSNLAWTDQQGQMSVDTTVKTEGTGSMRVDFPTAAGAGSGWWDDWTTSKDFNANWSSFSSLSLWSKVSDLSGTERIDQITIWDIPGHATRFNLSQPGTTDWTQFTIPLSSFVPDNTAVDWTQVKAIQIKFTTWDTAVTGSSSVWLDNMQLNAVPEPSAFALVGVGLTVLLKSRKKQ